MANVLSFRLAVPTDLQAVVEMSRDIYGGYDHFVGDFINYLSDPNRRILIAEKDGKAVGLQVMHIIDEGETVIAQRLRVHVEYRSQGIGKRLVQECRNYVKENFPQVRFERYSVSSAAVARLGIQKKSDDILFHKMAFFICFVDGDVFLQLASRLARYITELCTTTDLKHLSKIEFEDLLKQKKLESVLFYKNICITFWQPFKALVSNIPNGLITDGDSFFASFSGESVESLSHSRWIVPTEKFPLLYTVCYTLDKEMVKAHIVKQLENTMLQHPGETFRLIFLVDTSLVDCTSKLLLNDLSLRNGKLKKDSKPYTYIFFCEKSLV